MAAWPGALVALVLAVAAVRATILFSSPLVPGMNGAYYLVQARSVLAHGTLGIPDLPLTFYLQAALAWVLRALTGQPLEPSIVLAVKLADALLPALVVVPVAWLVRRWAALSRAPAWIALAAGATAALNGPVLGMVGDFQKNSLGLVWLAALLYAIQLWMEAPSPRRAVAVIGFWGLIGLTHIAVFGASLLMGALAFLFYRAHHRFQWRTAAPLLLAALGVTVLAAGLVLWKFDSQRIGKLAGALAHPAHYLTGDAMGGGGPGGGGPGSPGGTGAFLFFFAAALSAFGAGWRHRRCFAHGEWCVPVACALGVVVLTGPWVQGDKTDRFALLAIGPAVLAAAFALVRLNRPWLRAGLAAALTLAMAASGWTALGRGGRGQVDEAGVRELRALAPRIANPGKTLVVARHGLEWWAAWTLHTHIAQPSALTEADWQTYEAVYFLKSNGGQRGGGPGGPGGPPPMGAGGPSSGWLLRKVGLRLSWGGPSGAPPRPPRDFEGGGPGEFEAGRGGGGPMDGPGGAPGGGPRGGGSMSDPQIPDDAQIIVHEGGLFTLARVASAPAFVVAPDGE